MSEFNTGKPPAGEAGLIAYAIRSGRYFKFWSGGDGFMFASECPARAFESKHLNGCAPDEWRWATLAELTASGIPESEARGMVHKSMLPDAPWLPPQQEGFGPWIEHGKDARPAVAHDARLMWLTGTERFHRRFDASFVRPIDWFSNFAQVKAYCVKLAATEQSEPTAAEVEATQKPQSPEDFVRDMERDEEAVMATDQNEAMKNRDALKRAITPPTKDEGWREYDPKYPPIQPYRMDFKTVVEGEHVRHFYRRADTSAVDVVLYARNGLILVAPWTNRLGGNWGAFE